jgi:hypothetical protein
VHVVGPGRLAAVHAGEIERGDENQRSGLRGNTVRELKMVGI